MEDFRFVKLLVFFVSLFLNGLAGDVPMENVCPSGLGGKLLRVQIDHCTGTGREASCTFVRGRTYRADITYTPSRHSNTQRIKCGSIVWNQPQIIADYDVCAELKYNVTCPMVADQTYTYGTSVKIPAVPPGTYPIYCEIVDDREIKQVCVQGNARLVLW